MIWKDYVIKAVGSSLLQAWNYMAVSIKGNLYAGMTQPLLHYLGVYTLLQH